MGLEKYWSKRDFTRTPEPRGEVASAETASAQVAPADVAPAEAARLGATPAAAAAAEIEPAAGSRRFVIQKHAASHLHYDFRLEIDGTLKSWAIPKGPSLDPGEKRLAVEVEDHPLAYGNFEGTIPAGEYGGGTVLLWDRGRWTPAGDPGDDYRRGHLRFRLDGEKLQGEWTLLRMGGRAAGDTRRNWLLVKARDAHAVDGDGDGITARRPESVQSGRDMDEITAGSALHDREAGRVRSAPASRAAPASGSSRRTAAAKSAPAAASAAKPARAATAAAKSARAATAAPASAHAYPDDDAAHHHAPEVEPVIAGVVISNPRRIVYPGDGLTKLDLARYYEQVGAWLLPQLRDRPLTLLRCPQGMHTECFFQRHLTRSLPDTLRAVTIPEEGATAVSMTADSLAAVIGLVQVGTLEFHTWGARRDRLEAPDRLILDLDPSPTLPWREVVAGALAVRELLAALELAAFVKTTGGRGLHVEVPLQRRHGWDEVKDVAQALAQRLAQEQPERFTAKAEKSARRGRLYVDYLRNTAGATAIAAYSTRAHEGATVALPLAWAELGDAPPGTWTVRNVPARLAQLRQDPWRDYDAARQVLRRRIFAALGLERAAR